MKVKQIEDLWKKLNLDFEELSISHLDEYQAWFMGYIISHFEQIYLGIRNVVCVNINIFKEGEGIKFIEMCCDVYNCKIIHIDQGEIWISRSKYLIDTDDIPSRLSENKEDHQLRGKLLGYSDIIIKNYFIEED